MNQMMRMFIISQSLLSLNSFCPLKSSLSMSLYNIVEWTSSINSIVRRYWTRIKLRFNIHCLFISSSILSLYNIAEWRSSINSIREDTMKIERQWTCGCCRDSLSSLSLNHWVFIVSQPSSSPQYLVSHCLHWLNSSSISCLHYLYLP